MKITLKIDKKGNTISTSRDNDNQSIYFRLIGTLAQNVARYERAGYRIISYVNNSSYVMAKIGKN